jgi:peroxiredoxin
MNDENRASVACRIGRAERSHRAAIPGSYPMLRVTACFLLLIGFATATARAGEFNSVLNIGDAAPAWKALPGTDEKPHSLDDLKKSKLVVVVFTCNSCPIATDYEDRILALADKYKGDAAFVAINVNTIPQDSLPKMKERAESKKFPFPYLFDESQKIAKDYGAKYTPEFFVLDADRKIAYMGGMDDSSIADKVKTKYLEPAIEAILKGDKPATAETNAIGCRVRYAREKR